MSADESRSATEIDAALHELAQDMLDVIQRLNALESLMGQTLRAVDTLRAELVGERRTFAVRALFDAAVRAVDTLEILSRSKEPSAEAVAMQVNAARVTLSNLLQAIGFSRFDVPVGDVYEPARMQCFGYAEGPPGIVLEAVQPGYAAGALIVRPAGVLIADPTAATSTVREGT